jgi:hypothetical protein
MSSVPAVLPGPGALMILDTLAGARRSHHDVLRDDSLRFELHADRRLRPAFQGRGQPLRRESESLDDNLDMSLRQRELDLAFSGGLSGGLACLHHGVLDRAVAADDVDDERAGWLGLQFGREETRDGHQEDRTKHHSGDSGAAKYR